MTQPPNGPNNSLVYVHFPFCASKCPYCDFNSHVMAHNDETYGDAILRELDLRWGELGERPLASIYFGGGTPSMWSPDQVERVIQAIKSVYRASAPELSRAGRTDPEVTLEVNPGECSADKFEAFRASGVNRFSIGCQSFLDHELEALGRLHNGLACTEAVVSAKRTGARVSMDLMYALPNQTQGQVKYSMEKALELEPDHISAYTLTVEPETPLARRTKLGLFRPMPDDEQAELIDLVQAFFEQGGFTRYEVSSFAKDNKVSVHNTGYWQGAAYLGLGAGAHSFIVEQEGCSVLSAIRQENYRSPARYLSHALGDYAPMRLEPQSALDVLTDRMMVVFRSRFGLSPEDLQSAFSIAPSHLESTLHRARADGLIEWSEARYRPTKRGFLFNDLLASIMVESAPELMTAGLRN